MKTILFAALLSVSGIALAQDTTDEGMTDDTMTEQPTTDPTVPPPADPTMPPTTTPPADPMAPPPADPTAQPMAVPATTGTPTTVAPGNENPARDARGIAVISNEATVPAGANQPVNAPAGATVVPSSNQSAVFAPQPSSGDYPRCTKEVTDNCIQGHERGVEPD